MRVKKPATEGLVLSAIIGVVEIVDVVERHRSKWFQGPYGFILANPQSLEKPIPCKGKLGLWDVSPELSRKIKKQLL